MLWDQINFWSKVSSIDLKPIQKVDISIWAFHLIHLLLLMLYASAINIKLWSWIFEIANHFVNDFYGPYIWDG